MPGLARRVPAVHRPTPQDPDRIAPEVRGCSQGFEGGPRSVGLLVAFTGGGYLLSRWLALPFLVGASAVLAAPGSWKSSTTRPRTRSPPSTPGRPAWPSVGSGYARFSSTGPYRLFVARRGDLVLGYAGSQRYRDHEAFRETVEVSVGLAVGARGQGVGTSLYRTLFACLADEPVHVALAGIAMPNDASVALHRKFGFTDVGTFRDYAVKNGQYLSSLWMQRLSTAG